MSNKNIESETDFMSLPAKSEKHEEKKFDSVGPSKPKCKKNPFLLQTIVMKEDFYSLSWIMLRSDIWTHHHHKVLRGQAIKPNSSDISLLFLYFICFIAIVILTFTLFFQDVFSGEMFNRSYTSIVILRVTLVFWGLKLLEPEFHQGVAKLRFTIKHPEKFTHLYFAYFICICQILVTCFSFAIMVLFICMAKTALKLIIEFAEVAIISELDDWVGENIVKDKPADESKKYPNEDFELNSINERMGLLNKMSMIGHHDLHLIDDENVTESTRFFNRAIWTISNWFPWILLPLVTFPVNYLLFHVQKHHPDYHP